MSVQVLVAAVNADKNQLLRKLNIQTDVIVSNQCSENRVENFLFNGNRVKWLSFAEKGVGLNRNNALMRADAEYCLIADDDMVYVNGYSEIVENAFQNNPDADVIIFNLEEPIRTRYIISKVTKVGYFNYLRYGAARIAIRLDKIRDNGIFFNLCFGGGTEHRHGEDNLFLNQCLKKGLKIVAIPQTIARLTEERESSWNAGYDNKYFVDQGCLYKLLSPRFWRILCIQDSIRHRKSYEKYGNIRATYRAMLSGGTNSGR